MLAKDKRTAAVGKIRPVTRKNQGFLRPAQLNLVKIYKYLQLNNIVSNGYFSRNFCPQATFFIIFFCSTSIYGMLTLAGIVPWFIYIIFAGLILLGSLAIIFVWAEFSQLNSESVWILAQFKRNLREQETCRAREMKSCQSLKIKNFSFHHFTLETPKTMTEEIINYVLLMLGQLG